MSENIFLLDGNTRILKWREFRNNLKQYDKFEQLTQISNWWAKCPESFPKLDDYNKKIWPTPWEILYEGDLCSTSIAYLMAETLKYGSVEWNDIKLMLVKNTSEHVQKMVVVINNEWVLNYNYSNIYEYSKLINECLILVTHTI